MRFAFEVSRFDTAGAVCGEYLLDHGYSATGVAAVLRTSVTGALAGAVAIPPASCCA